MKKFPGLSAALRHTLRHLAVLFLGVAAVAAPGTASARRPEHSTHARRSESAERPDFSRASASAKANRKHAPSPNSRSGSNGRPSGSAKGNEHRAQDGQRGGESKPSAKAPRKGSARRKHQIEPDDDFSPMTMKRVGHPHDDRYAPAKSSGRRQVAEREPAPAVRTRGRAGHNEQGRIEQGRSELAANSYREAPRRATPVPVGRATPEPEHAAVAASHPLSTDDFLRAAHGQSGPEAEGTPHVAERTALRLLHAGNAAPYATGVAHPAEGPVTVATAPAASHPAPSTSSASYIDERQVAEAQRVAIGAALRPAANTQELAANTQQPQPRVAASSLPASAPTASAYTSEPSEPHIATYAQQAAITPAAVSAPPSERAYLAARAVDGDAASRAPEDVVRSTALGQLSHQEMATAAVAPTLPGMYSREGHLIMPAPLKGSHEVLVHQNEMADAAGLTRIRNDRDLDQLRQQHRLVNFPESDGLRVNPELPERRRCARPWTVAFAAQMARAYYNEFHEPFTISSAVRTMAYQVRLQRVNGNAASIRGEGASPHLTGQAFDIGKTGMTRDEIAWLRTYLAPLIDTGKIDVEEEFQQACFHISVYPGAATHRRTQLAQIQ